VFFLVLVAKQQQEAESPSSSLNMSQAFNYTSNINQENATTVLYIVTSLLEINEGSRMTIEGQDRFLYQLLPVMINTVESMMSQNFDVDLFLVCGYSLRPEREEIIRTRLPYGVGFQFWDDAIPLAYTGSNISGKIQIFKGALSRQHRFVVGDKLEYYDMFIAFEDDMFVHGHAVHHYLQLSLEIERLRMLAPENLTEGKGYESKKFLPMTKRQLERVVPGFMRVEVIVNETNRGAQKHVDSIPIDHEFDYGEGAIHRDIDPSICCHVYMESNEGTGNIPEIPPADHLIVWETNIKAFSLRLLTKKSDVLDWVVLMQGPGKLLTEDEKIGGFWSGRHGAFKKEKKPSGGKIWCYLLTVYLTIQGFLRFYETKTLILSQIMFISL